MTTIRKLAKDAANECWEFMLDTPYTAEGDVDAEVPAMTKIVEAAIREGIGRVQHSILSALKGDYAEGQNLVDGGFFDTTRKEKEDDA